MSNPAMIYIHFSNTSLKVSLDDLTKHAILSIVFTIFSSYLISLYLYSSDLLSSVLSEQWAHYRSLKVDEQDY